jgi:hypothetical protein
MRTLTGRIRHRVEIVKRSYITDQYLVLQVEEKHQEISTGIWIAQWRDAKVEDLTTITLNSLKQVKQE